MYNYSWGSEDGSYTIKIIKVQNEYYKITMEQSLFYENPYELCTDHEIISTETQKEKDEMFYNYITTLNIKAKCNPPPEDLFYYK